MGEYLCVECCVGELFDGDFEVFVECFYGVCCVVYYELVVVV